MGAVVAFELARELRRRGRPLPRVLIASGARAPQFRRGHTPPPAPSREAFLEELRRLGGLPTDDPALLGALLPALEADATLYRHYVYREGEPFAFPIRAYGGTDDPNIRAEHLEGWGEQTTGRVRRPHLSRRAFLYELVPRTVPGGAGGGPGMIDVWRVHLDTAVVPPPIPGELARAARFATDELARRYLAAHGALRAILGKFTAAPLEFALLEKGKPYLPLSPEVRFNLAHSQDRALIAVSLEVDVGVDIERIRPMRRLCRGSRALLPCRARRNPSTSSISSAAGRVWRRCSRRPAPGCTVWARRCRGEWTVVEVDAGEGFAGAVAGAGPRHTVRMHDFGADE